MIEVAKVMMSVLAVRCDVPDASADDEAEYPALQPAIGHSRIRTRARPEAAKQTIQLLYNFCQSYAG